jgi:hypothetical protein
MNEIFDESNTGGRSMQVARAWVFAFVLMTSGCASLMPPSIITPPLAGPPQPAVESAVPGVATSPQPDVMTAAAATQPGRTEATPAAKPEAPPGAVAAAQPKGKIVSPLAKPAAKAPAPPAAPPVGTVAAPTDAAKPKAPPLDLAALEQRLKETRAIGVLTKITLKNQVDDLLDRFRAFYLGKLNTTVAELRRSYDLLVLKVLALLQDGDQALATAIAGSREAIWGILSDPAKFAKI